MSKQLTVSVDVSAFALVNAIDTCSIWNMLSSPRLLSAALAKGCGFVVAGYVRYEAIEKQRTNPSQADLIMQQNLKGRLENKKGFASEPISLSDLTAVANIPEVRRLGRGEIAALALARKLRSAILTDDQRARWLASKAGVDRAQTTPHLLGWLLYEGALSDGDVGDIIIEHERQVAEKQGRLSVHFRRIHEEACRCRLLRYQTITIVPAA